MNDTNFKILLGVTESGVYHVYDTSNQNVIKMDNEQFEKEKHSIRCSDSSNRNDGTVAVLYQVQDNRFIVVNGYGKLHFRTFTEIKHSIKTYFNVLIEDNTIRLTDGKLFKASKYMEVVTYIDMFQQSTLRGNAKIMFEIDEDSYDVTLRKVRNFEGGYFYMPNFVKHIDKECFVSINIGSITISRYIKSIDSKAFCNCNIDNITIEGSNLKIHDGAFYCCIIQKVVMREISRLDIFDKCNVSILDLSYLKSMSMNYSIFNGIAKVCRIITNNKLKSLDLDKIPETTEELYISSKTIKLTGSNKYDISKLNRDISSGKKEFILKNYLK